MRNFTCIAAACQGWGIGHDGDIPWKRTNRGRKDMKFFQLRTRGHVVIMGRKTADSIDRDYFPLADRVNIVVTSHVDGIVSLGVLTDRPVYYVGSLEIALKIADQYGSMDTYVIGGSMIYNEAMAHPRCDRVIVTRIPFGYICDRFIDPTLFESWPMHEIDYMGLTISVYEHKSIYSIT